MRTLIFVDEANFQKSAISAGFRPDIVGLRNWLRDGGRRQIIEMVAYLGLPPERRLDDMPDNWQRAYDSKHRLRMALENNGIMVVAWRGKQLFGYDPPRFAANIDMLMAMDELEFAIDARPDVVVLVTGDGDFSYLANKLRRRGIRVEAAALASTLSGELKRAVHQVIDLKAFFADHGQQQDDDTPDDADWDDDDWDQD
ncbi:MAG: NYN domain-containing protein [Sphingopyxis sp.]